MIRIIVLFILALPSFAQAQYLDGLPQAKLPLQSTTIMPVCQGGTLGRPGTCTTAQATIASFSLASQGIINVLSAGALCNGTANDTSAIQAIITGAANVAAVYVPPGVTCMVGTLSLPSYTDLIIDGTMELIAGTNAGMLVLANNATYVVIEGHGTLNGNASAQTSGFSGAIQNLGSPTYIWVRDITSTNWRNTPFGLTNASHAWLSNAVFSNSGNSVGFSINSTDCWADHITISGVADEGYAFYGGTHGCGITNSTINGNAGAGVSLLNDAGQPSPSYDILISGNILFGNAFSGIDVQSGIGAGASHSKVTITANRIFGNNTGNHNQEGGINLTNVVGAVVTGNHISADGVGSSGAAGIAIISPATNIQLVGNFIYDEGQGSTLGVGIEDVSATNVLMADNTIYDDQGTQTVAFGINGTAGSGTQVLNNKLGLVIGASNNLTPASDTVIVGATNAGSPFYEVYGTLNVKGALNAVGAANNIAMQGVTTTFAPTITAFGSDTNISINALPKGTGGFDVLGPINAVGSANNIGLGGASTGVAPTITAFGSDTNISLGFITKGTGVLVINGQSAVSCAANTVSLTTLTITAGLVTHC